MEPHQPFGQNEDGEGKGNAVFLSNLMASQEKRSQSMIATGKISKDFTQKVVFE